MFIFPVHLSLSNFKKFLQLNIEQFFHLLRLKINILYAVTLVKSSEYNCIHNFPLGSWSNHVSFVWTKQNISWWFALYIFFFWWLFISRFAAHKEDHKKWWLEHQLWGGGVRRRGEGQNQLLVMGGEARFGRQKRT